MGKEEGEACLKQERERAQGKLKGVAYTVGMHCVDVHSGCAWHERAQRGCQRRGMYYVITLMVP
jgi:hypothetical protein